MTNEEIIDAIERLQGTLSHAESTMRQPTKYIAEAQARADKAVEALRKRTWVGLTRDEQSFVYSSLHNATSREDSFWVDFANAIETKLKEKNT